ncbi:thioesterase family protein [Gordonia sp. PKS22-38]|uniref:Thioesterase family protein n=1 Tax=Gordonia prachuapensis TaxID=3115651 RepID=A0ABU7N004_9ACTN|nr:thioesterase family protein [Gordonia sp. PKS22-38]
MSRKLADLLTLTEVSRPGEDRITYRAVIDPVFTIGPKVHGGSLQMIVARAAAQALTDLAPAGDDRALGKMPVAITSDFLAAPDAAEIDLEVTVRKRGRTVTVMTVDAVQNGRTMVPSSVTCARPDTGTPHHSAPTILDDTAAEPPADGIGIDNSPVSEVMHLGPALDLVLDPATFPIVRGETGAPVVRGWVRPKEDRAPDTDFAVLVCDISPPVVMNLALFGWAPTVQLTTYVRRHPAPGWLRFAATSTEVGPGMFEEDHLVVDSTGTVVAQSRQLALIPQQS